LETDKYYEKYSENVIIRSAKYEDFDEVLPLCDRRFGTGYVDRAEFDKWLKYPQFCLVMEYDGDFVGYVCILPSTPEKVCEDMQLPLDEVSAECEGKKVIRCRSAILKEKYENRGYMRVLWEKVFANAKSCGYGISYCPAWKYDGKVPMHNLLTKLGFEVIAEKQMLWYDEINYTCVVCKGRCACPGVVYKLHI